MWNWHVLPTNIAEIWNMARCFFQDACCHRVHAVHGGQASPCCLNLSGLSMVGEPHHAFLNLSGRASLISPQTSCRDHRYSWASTLCVHGLRCVRRSPAAFSSFAHVAFFFPCHHHAQGWAHMRSARHPLQAELPAPQWALQMDFLSVLKTGSPHALSCFHHDRAGASGWPGWVARTEQRMAGHPHSSCTTSTSLQGPESSRRCWHTAALQPAASAVGLQLLLLWATPCFSRSQTIQLSRNGEEVGLEVLLLQRLFLLHPHSARLSPRPFCAQPEACHTAHTGSAFSGSTAPALVWMRCNQSPLESLASALLSEFPWRETGPGARPWGSTWRALHHGRASLDQCRASLDTEKCRASLDQSLPIWALQKLPTRSQGRACSEKKNATKSCALKTHEKPCGLRSLTKSTYTHLVTWDSRGT